MVFGLFKKKNVLDLRASGGIPTKGYLKRKGISGEQVSLNKQEASSSGNLSSGGGFFGFFGNSDSGSDSNNNSGASNANTDFWGNPVLGSGSGSRGVSPNVSVTEISRMQERLNDISDRFSRLLDRVELLEKKMERAERRTS
jgi:hypothetical protein